MNVFNMLWAFFATIMGLVLVMVYAPIGEPLINVAFGAATSCGGICANYYIAMLGYYSFSIIMLLMFPIVIALDDDARLKMKQIATG